MDTLILAPAYHRAYQRCAINDSHFQTFISNKRNQMKAATERKIIRWIHILLSIPILGYIYGPVATLKYPALATKFIFLPIIVLSGFWLWKGHWIKMWIRGKLPNQQKKNLHERHKHSLTKTVS